MKKSKGLIVGIDASRNRSGGAKAHIIGLLSESCPEDYGITEIHVWSFSSLLDSLPDRPWLVKHNPIALEKSIAKQLFWQATELSAEAKKFNCDILFTTDASTLCLFKPMVVLSQDMLSYEAGVMASFGINLARLRLLAILFIQNAAFRRANGVIFLTKYSAKVIQQSCGSLRNISFIPHGIGDAFKSANKSGYVKFSAGRPIRCIYVSPVWEFKHQWVVVRAVELLRRRGIDVVLELVGGGNEVSISKLDNQLQKSDPSGKFVSRIGEVKQSELPNYLGNADIFVFASSCENLPITLLEAMAIGMPIASSDRGPMPEVLKNGGIYFDPEDEFSIADAIEKIIHDTPLRLRVSEKAKELSEDYSWKRCAEETLRFISETCKSTKVIY